MRLESIFRWGKYVAGALFVLYFASMVVWPVAANGGDWTYVQQVWDRWQALNVGVLALISSVVVFYATRYSAETQRAREFMASKAFLPAALSDLSQYFEESARVLTACWDEYPRAPANLHVPILPVGYEKIFGDCIRHADPKVGDYLSRILRQLQVHDARLKGYVATYDEDSDEMGIRLNIISYLYRVAQLQAWVNKLFPFARSLQRFDDTPLVWPDYANAYSNLNIWPEEFKYSGDRTLVEFTRDRLSRKDDEQFSMT
jgi:hypothetical protein